MPDYFLKVSPLLIEPPPDRTDSAVYVPVPTGSGVRGVPHRLQAVRTSTQLAVLFYLHYVYFSL